MGRTFLARPLLEVHAHHGLGVDPKGYLLDLHGLEQGGDLLLGFLGSLLFGLPLRLLGGRLLLLYGTAGGDLLLYLRYMLLGLG